MSVVDSTDPAAERAPRPRTSRLTVVVAVGLTLLLGLAATTATARWRAEREEASRMEILDGLTDDAVARVNGALLRYADLLQSLAAFQTESDRSLAGYADYVDEIDLSRYAGVQNTAYVQSVREAELSAVIAERRADGQPGFTLDTAAGVTEHAIVAYAAPTPSTAPGLDIMGDETRREALRYAADTGEAAISGAVVPLAELDLPPEEQTPGLVAYVAVYEPGAPVTTMAQRRAALLGWTSISMDLNEALTSLSLDGGFLDVVVLIDDDEDGSISVAESVPGAAARIAGQEQTDRSTIVTGSRNVEVRTAFAPGQEPTQDVLVVPIFGALISLLAAYGVYATLRFRRGLLARADAERQRAELLASRFHAAVDRAPVGVTVVGLDGTIELFNDRLAELVQVPEEDLVPSMFDYYLPADIPELIERFGQLTRGEVDHMVADRQLRRHDGTLVWCRISSSTLLGPDGRPTAVVAHVEDIEAELGAVEELRSRTRWFSSIVERSTDLIGLIDGKGVVMWASPSTQAILGNGPEVIVGLSILDLVLPEDRERMADAIRLVQTGEPVRIEYRVRTLAGKIVWLETSASDLLDDPDVGAIITFTRDVTEQHRTGEILAHQAAHDPLTGLLNRAELRNSLEIELAAEGSDRDPVTVAFLDLDGFKAINDEHGHAAGDDLLGVVAGILRDEVRGQDVIARFGGDEFVIMVRGAGLAAALRITERIRRRMHAPITLVGAPEPVQLSVSIGLAAGSINDTVDTLLHEADLALYEAKRRGRDRVEVSSHGLAALGVEVDQLLQAALRDVD